ncbi:MAG TPA: carbohydrate kinase family protein [Bacteroidota bacterium]|nr:carbohydrate kinase family protein [Bacteroidota bacterium]
MTITVLGHICIDCIHENDKVVAENYGGIFFSLASLANLLGEDDRIYPVFGIGKSDYDAFIDRLKKYPNVDPSGIYKFNGPTNRIKLVYTEKEHFVEKSEHISEPILWKKIRPYLETEMVLINMISGHDLTLETLDEIRMEVRENHIPIYLDVHSLTLGSNPDFTRYLRPIEEWRRWFFMLHCVKMNEEEAGIITKEHAAEEMLAKHVLALNTQSMIVTRGKKGCTTYIDNHKAVRTVNTPGIEIENPVDATGCGDVFAGAYCANYLRTGDIESSVEFANRAAAVKAGIFSSVEIDKLSVLRLNGVVKK